LFELLAALFGWLFVFPGRVLLDAEGFTVKGHGPGSWRVSWRDVDAFVTLADGTSRSGIVGFRCRSGWRHPSRRRHVRFGGADELLPVKWRSAQSVADQLNAYRVRALAAGTATSPKAD